MSDLLVEHACGKGPYGPVCCQKCFDAITCMAPEYLCETGAEIYAEEKRLLAKLAVTRLATTSYIAPPPWVLCPRCGKLPREADEDAAIRANGNEPVTCKACQRIWRPCRNEGDK